MRKYKNVKVDGFDSKRERDRYYELKMMQNAGLISDLKTQVEFELIPSQKIDGKVAERSCKYKADFTYCENGKLVVEDTKGFRTKDYIIKRKLMLYIHGIRVREI